MGKWIMTELIPSILAHLNQRSDVTDTFGYRLTGDKIPDEQDYPHGRLWIVSTPYQYHLLGESGRRALVQIDLFGETQASLDAGVSAIRSALSGYRGMMGDIDVGYCFIRNLMGNWDVNTRKYHRVLEVEFATND
jgi:hypothetical protein